MSGTGDINYYEVWIGHMRDGSRFREWTNGLNVAADTYVTDYTLINTSKRCAVSVVVTNYELASCPWQWINEIDRKLLGCNVDVQD